MIEAKDFIKSQNRFSEWRSKKYANSICMFQVFDFEVGISVEKWKSFKINSNEIELYYVELYPNGNGFSTYYLK